MIDGLSHITLIVADIEKTAELFRILFDAKEVYSSGDKPFSLSREKFLTVGDLWIALMEGESLSERTYNHIAFKIDDASYEEYFSKIKALGLDMKPPRPRINGEGRSLYFYDYDNHMFELHTGTLNERLMWYNKENDL